MKVFTVTGKSRAVRVSAMLAAAAATALVLGASVGQQADGAIGSEPQSQVMAQATCCSGGFPIGFPPAAL